MEENVRRMKQQFMAPQDVSRDGRVQMKEVPFPTVPFPTVPFSTEPFWAVISPER